MSVMKLTEMRELLAKRDIQLTKSLGQNFLHDANQLERIVAAGEVTKADKILEIGPGLGLMAGVELNFPDGRPATQPALDAIKKLLHRGYIFLPEGEHGNIISFTPPLTITQAQLASAVTALAEVLAEI